jgi:hypothetical protein
MVVGLVPQALAPFFLFTVMLAPGEPVIKKRMFNLEVSFTS